MEWIYLSPHLDDVVYSCGGLIWERVQLGDRVSVWTIFSGDPDHLPLSTFAQSLHTRWGIDGDRLTSRRYEDVRACNKLGVTAQHMRHPEAVYRVESQDRAHLYPTEASVFGVVSKGDEDLIRMLKNEIAGALPRDATVVVPLALGNHVDHVILHQVSAQLINPLRFYADFPYVLKELDALDTALKRNLHFKHYPLSDEAIANWIAAIREYKSQFSTFWSSEDELHEDVNILINKWSGMRLWQQIRT